MAKRHSPYHVLTVVYGYFKLLGEGVQNSGCINHTSSETQEGEILEQPLPGAVRTEVTTYRSATEVRITKDQQYAVKRIVGQVTTKKRPQYVVRWYRYGSERESVDPPQDVQWDFGDAYWLWRKRQSAPTKQKRNDGIHCKNPNATILNK